MVDNLIHVDLTADERELLTSGLNERPWPRGGRTRLGSARRGPHHRGVL